MFRIKTSPFQRSSLTLIFGLITASALMAQSSGPAYRFKTNLGDIDVVLTPDVAPLTVANFINYVAKGAYTNSIFHRSVPGFIIQGGGFRLENHSPVAIDQDPPVKNEFNVTNSRGTIAMAKLGSSPDSATNQWFFNLANNGSNLDNQNGGFTVFGRILNSAGLTVMDRIAAQKVYNAGSPFDSLPLANYTSGTIQDSNFVLVSSIVPLPLFPSAGITSAASYARANTNGIAPGEFITIFGSGLGPTDLVTLTLDNNGVVTTSLAGTRVLFDGTPAPLVYTSSGQLSVVAPQNLAGKSTVSVVVEYQKLQTTSVSYPVAATNPGIFTLDTSGQGDGAIIRPDGTVINAGTPGVPGEILVLYGEGYGATSTPVPDGTLLSSVLPAPLAPVTLLIDGQPAEIKYAGGAPSLIAGVLQVNFVVPPVGPGPHQIQLQVGSKTSPAGVILRTK